MKISDKRLNLIIKESINRFLSETEQISVNTGGNGKWESWSETDRRNGITPEQGKAMRMQSNGVNPSYEKELERVNSIPRKKVSEVNPPSFEEWNNNFRHMPYREYAEKRKNGEL